MSFVNFPKMSVSIRTEDVVGLQISGADDGGYELKVYMRGSDEPIKIYNRDQLPLTDIYDTLASYVSDEVE